MLILPNACFLHVPKTGGSWVKKAIAAAGIECQDYRLAGDPHIGLQDCPCPEKFKFAFVRHPVDLYRSYWQFKMTNGWDEKNPLDQSCQSDDFHQFTRDVLNILGFRIFDSENFSATDLLSLYKPVRIGSLINMMFLSFSFRLSMRTTLSHSFMNFLKNILFPYTPL